MGRKPKDLNRIQKETEGTFDERSFIDGVFNAEYILVVGNGVVLNREKFPQTGGDINQYILNEINKDRRKERTNFTDYRNFTDVVRDTSLNEHDLIYSLLTNGYDYDLSDISPELTKLLCTKLFKFVLTTTIDSYMETLMRDIYGDELRIVNISDNESVKDFRIALENCRVNEYNQPTLFYIFGKVAPPEKPKGFMETDVDAIRYIEKWINIDSKSIVPFMKKKRMLALGCKFDDWYFRFFWYILTRGFSDNDRDGVKDIDGSILTRDNLATLFNPNDPADQKLKEYLQHRGVCMHDDVWSFMTHIYSMLTSIELDSPFYKMVLEKRREGGVFISYKSCNYLFASELFYKLARQRHLNVWLDTENLNGGDKFEMIYDAIQKSKVFISILSTEVSDELIKYGDSIDTYYSKEWRWAAENKDLIKLPVAIGDYNLQGEQHKIFEKLVASEETVGIDMSKKTRKSTVEEKTGFAKLLDSINKQLGVKDYE